MLQKALHRARRISAATRILVTAAEAHRSHWQSALWFIPTEHRFLSEFPGWSSLTTAAAVLSIAAREPSASVTILPARSYVADEWTLTLALHTALSKLAFVADGVVTLGMQGGASEVDEDYLIVDDQPGGRPIVPVSLTARRPMDWVAHHLVGRGALVASGIYVGHADALAALLYKYWPSSPTSSCDMCRARSPPELKTASHRPWCGKHYRRHRNRFGSICRGCLCVRCVSRIAGGVAFALRAPSSKLWPRNRAPFW